MRPLFITMVFLAIIVFGLVSYSRLGVDLLPSVNFPVVTVVTAYPGASPSSVENLVTVPVEDALSGLSDLDYITSTSVEGVSTVIIVFTERANTDAAAIDVERKLNTIRATLPTDVQAPAIVKADINAAPILNLSLSGPLTPAELTKLADDTIVPGLNSVNGVASVSEVGSRKREIQVVVDTAKLRGYGLSILQVNNALTQENVNVPSGQITETGRELSVRLNSEAAVPAELGNIVLSSTPNGTVRLRDVAGIKDTIVKQTQINRSSGQSSVGLLVTKQSTANTVAVADAVKKKLADLSGTLPEGARVDVVTDASVFTRNSLNGVQRELGEAVVLVGLVLLVFLHAWRSTFIVLLAIPSSLIATFLAMYVLGFTLNLMSLLGLTLTIGILVDDSIVVLENIFRHLEMGEEPVPAAIAGRSEIGLAAIAITLVDVVVFTPVALVSGITGQFFRQFGLVVVVAALFSLFVSFTLTPMLASRWLRAPSIHDRSPLATFGRAWEAGFSRLTRIYRGILWWSLRHRWPVIAAGLAAFAAGVVLVASNVVGTEFVPDADQSEFTLVAEMPPGTALEVTDGAMASIEQQLAGWPEVQRTFTSVGVAGDNKPNQSRFGRMIVKLVPVQDRKLSSVQLADKARALAEGVPDLKLRTVLPSLAGPGGSPIQVQVRGDDEQELARLAAQVQSAVEAVPGVRDVQNSGIAGQPEVTVTLDRARAADLGVSAGQVASALRTALAGSVVTQFRPQGSKGVDVRVVVPGNQLGSVAQIQQLPLTTSNGTTVNLGQFATVDQSVGLPQIDRRDRQKLITVSADITGRGLGDVSADVRKALDGLAVPPGYSAKLGGAAQEQQDSFAQLFQALGLSVLLTYMVTVALYESFLTPLVVLTSLPLALVGAIGALALTDSRLSLLSLIGIIMLVGLVGKNAILLLDYTMTLQKRGLSRNEALLQAGPTRLRPILMTTFSLVIALLPVAIGVTEGSELRRPIAIPVIGGMLTSTLLTLVFIPAVYTLLDDFRTAVGRVFHRKGPAAVEEQRGGAKASTLAPVPIEPKLRESRRRRESSE